MSHASIATLPLQTAYSAEVSSSFMAMPVTGASKAPAGIRTIVATGAPSQASRAKLKGFQLKRRLKGFVSEALGETWKTVFIVDGQEIPYELPAKELKQAKIEDRYQPFEMDEFVSTIPGLVGKLYKFRPLAKSAAATLETLPLDPEQNRKRNLILARFKKA